MEVNVYELALASVPHVGSVQARQLIARFGTAEAIFRAPKALLEKTEGIGKIRADMISSYKDFKALEQEIRLLKKRGVRAFFLTHPSYPSRLLNCYDPPVVVYLEGNVNLNTRRIISIIGTRNNTRYGSMLTDKLISGLPREDFLIISGLAYGIDALAHRAALRYGIPTLAVLASGTDIIYPQEHYQLAREMVSQGGLLSEFRQGTQPDRFHFPSRNRIVAGMSDAVVVIESGEKGGSLITADLALGYHKDVFAFPGRAGDPVSAGCNNLIASQKAQLIQSADNLLEAMLWTTKPNKREIIQQRIFPELTGEEKIVYDLLCGQEHLHIDSISRESALSPGKLASVLLQLELKSIIQAGPGNIYMLVHSTGAQGR